MDNIELLNELSKKYCNYDYTVSDNQTYNAYLFAAAFYNIMINQLQVRLKQKDICKAYSMDLSKFCRLLNNCENSIFKNDDFKQNYETYCLVIKVFAQDNYDNE